MITTSGSRERFLHDEEGFSLTEMMITTVIMMIVLFALYSIFDMGVNVFSSGKNKVEAVENARVALDKMEREIRQAYPYNRNASPSDTHLFDIWTSTQIRFGNDLDGTGIIACLNPSGQCEKIGYQLDGTTLGRDNTSTGATNTVANLQPVAEHVQSLAFTYYDRNGNIVNPGGTEANIDRVLIGLVISVKPGTPNEGRQELTTVVDLRNR